MLLVIRFPVAVCREVIIDPRRATRHSYQQLQLARRIE
jgi:hypothetical protein